MVFGNCDVWGEHTGDFYRMQAKGVSKVRLGLRRSRTGKMGRTATAFTRSKQRYRLIEKEG